MRRLTKGKAALLFFGLLGSSCSFSGAAGAKTIYNVVFSMATAGNCLNLNIYQPDQGPADFISYRDYFSSCDVDLNYEGEATFSYTLKSGETFSETGTYNSGEAKFGNTTSVFFPSGRTHVFYWPSYYQMYSSFQINLPNLGPTIITILFQARSIFG